MAREFGSNVGQAAHKYRCGEDPVELSPKDASKCDLYFIRMEVDVRPIKIGKSFATGKRHRILQSGSPYPLACVGLLYGEAPFEPEWHRRFHAQRMLGEWFEPIPELLKAIEVAVKEGSRKALGLPEPRNWEAELGLTTIKSG